MKRSVIALCAIILLSLCINSCKDENKSASPASEPKTEDSTASERKKDSVAILPAEPEKRDTSSSGNESNPTVKKIDLHKTAAIDQSVIKEGKELIAKSDCLACHKIQGKLVGPAYAAVAGKYSFDNTTVQSLASKIISGGTGMWGQVPMTPHPNLTPEVAKKMVTYILSLKK